MTSEQKDHMLNVLTHVVVNGEKKYVQGQKEHGGDMWLKPGMFSELEQELLDFIFYSATVREQLEACHQAMEAGMFIEAKLSLAAILGKP